MRMPEGAPRGKTIGVVTAVRPQSLVVRFRSRSHDVTLPGRMKKGRRETTAPLVVGDRVELVEERDRLRIKDVLPRRNEISRVDSLRPLRRHILAANVDAAVSVISAWEPAFNRRLLDRLLLLGEVAGVPGVICVNKWDLVDRLGPQDLSPYEDLGYRVVRASALNGSGMAELQGILEDHASLFTGASGVGKSSLINRLVPGANLSTNPLSEATGRGVHTTARVDWIDLPSGGVVLDTPGLRHIRPWGLEPVNLSQYFPEFRDLTHSCRFRDCLHRSEPDCAVRKSLRARPAFGARYESYTRILESLESGELW